MQTVLKKKIAHKADLVKEKEILLYQQVLYNVQYGLANQELKTLADAYGNLKHMRKIIDYTTSAPMSRNLQKNWRNEQKVKLRAIVKKKMSVL